MRLVGPPIVFLDDAHMPPFLIVFGLLILATSCEAAGDALVRLGLLERTGFARAVPIMIGAGLLLGYGIFLNLAPLPFGRVVGFYIATLFVVWQIVNFITFRSVPTVPILVGGGLIIAGGLVVSFWGSAAASAD